MIKRASLIALLLLALAMLGCSSKAQAESETSDVQMEWRSFEEAGLEVSTGSGEVSLAPMGTVDVCYLLNVETRELAVASFVGDIGLGSYGPENAQPGETVLIIQHARNEVLLIEGNAPLVVAPFPEQGEGFRSYLYILPEELASEVIDSLGVSFPGTIVYIT